MKITLILAGTNEPSNAETLAEAFLKGIQNSGEQVATDRLKLSELSLDHFNLSYYDKNTKCVSLVCVKLFWKRFHRRILTSGLLTQSRRMSLVSLEKRALHANSKRTFLDSDSRV
jgi:hypothetical protein